MPKHFFQMFKDVKKKCTKRKTRLTNNNCPLTENLNNTIYLKWIQKLIEVYIFWILYFYKWNLIENIMNFTNDFTWDVSLASDFISENSLEIFWFSQVISRGTFPGRWQAIRQFSI